MTNTILHINSSARFQDSVTRMLGDEIVDTLTPTKTLDRDLAKMPIPVLTEDWVSANFTPADLRSDAQKTVLQLSDQLIDEMIEADTLVIGAPMYNFGIPATLKAWIDHVSRVGRTFQYTENGPIGLLENKRAIVVIATGGTPVPSDIDFVSPYMRQFLGFVGITDVTFISADALGSGAEAKVALAKDAIQALVA